LSFVDGLRRILVVVCMGIASDARGQAPGAVRSDRLSVGAAVAATVSTIRPRVARPPLATEGASPPFDVRSVIETVSGALRATPTLRAADATVGTALIALGVRRHHSTSAAVVVGVHAIDLALGQRVTG